MSCFKKKKRSLFVPYFENMKQIEKEVKQMSTGFTKEQISELSLKFRLITKNKPKLLREDFPSAICELGVDLYSDFSLRVFDSAVSPPGKNEMSLKEFVFFISKLCSEKVEDHALLSYGFIQPNGQQEFSILEVKSFVALVFRSRVKNNAGTFTEGKGSQKEKEKEILESASAFFELISEDQPIVTRTQFTQKFLEEKEIQDLFNSLLKGLAHITKDQRDQRENKIFEAFLAFEQSLDHIQKLARKTLLKNGLFQKTESLNTNKLGNLKKWAKDLYFQMRYSLKSVEDLQGTNIVEKECDFLPKKESEIDDSDSKRLLSPEDTIQASSLMVRPSLMANSLSSLRKRADPLEVAPAFPDDEIPKSEEEGNLSMLDSDKNEEVKTPVDKKIDKISRISSSRQNICSLNEQLRKEQSMSSMDSSSFSKMGSKVFKKFNTVAQKQNNAVSLLEKGKTEKMKKSKTHGEDKDSDKDSELVLKVVELQDYIKFKKDGFFPELSLGMEPSIPKRKSGKVEGDDKMMMNIFNINQNLILPIMRGLSLSLKNIQITINLADEFFYNQKFTYEVPVNLSKAGSFKADDFFTFFDYSPSIFANIRLLLGITSDAYKKSVGNVEEIQTSIFVGKANTMQQMMEKGKSGSGFFFSLDYNYLFKSISKKEFDFFQSILPSYTHFLHQNNDSLLNKIVGMHALRKGTRKNKMYFLVLQNILGNFQNLTKFDLKGSFYNRSGGSTKTLLKDLDFLRMKKEGFQIDLAENDSKFILSELQKDSKFLESIHVNDYSLLIGCYFLAPNEHIETTGTPPFSMGSSLFISSSL